MAVVFEVSKLLSVDDSPRLPAGVDLIGVVSMGSSGNGLSSGATETVWEARRILARYSFQPNLVYGSFAGNPTNSTTEQEEKQRIFGAKAHYVGSVWTTITECLAFKKAFPNAKRVVFVTEEAHSRRARVVWKCLWPEAEIYIISVPLENCIDAQSTMATYHNAWKALTLQVVPLPIYKILAMLGPQWLRLVENIHQPTTV